MYKLYGFARSNYYNKVKLALLEKALAFEEIVAMPGSPDYLARCPTGKIPYFETEEGGFCESQAIVEYLEECHPEPALLPASLQERAKVRELLLVLETGIDLSARRLLPHLLLGHPLADAVKEEARSQLKRGVAAFARLAKFSPYVAGADFTLADCAAAFHLPLASRISRRIYDEDLLAELPLAAYRETLAARPTYQRAMADFDASRPLWR
ncbi:glutathione S-transferase family protein [Chitinimonas lacunae]|uniref:Glutathione S-transferase family protein n=1 Tax=Chitinimonas lacunae TaxID=1963018 RepID=A0ABV8MT97_9NEIS